MAGFEKLPRYLRLPSRSARRIRRDIDDELQLQIDLWGGHDRPPDPGGDLRGARRGGGRRVRGASDASGPDGPCRGVAGIASRPHCGGPIAAPN